ncbi:MAG: FkbM family methyltransferase [Phycisphaerales bacterium]|nr:MAG: FkbM family methyltransferase [Phycisphaerales bacterium]
MPEVLLTIAAFVIAAAGAGIAFNADKRVRSLRTRLERLRVRFDRAEGELLRTRQTLAASQVREALRANGREATLPIEFRSQYGEDVLLWDVFGPSLEGFFIEVGAYDGVALSVTRALEAAGWTGLLIEALPERAAQCARNRPNSRVEHAALGKPGGPATVTFSAVEHATPGMDMLSHIDAPDATTEHKETIEREGARTKSVTVPMTTMDALLAKAPPSRIDAVVIDVEGAEASLLAGFDLKKWRPRVIVIEDNTMGEDDRVASIVRAGGYTECGWVGVNRVFVRTDETGLIERVRASCASLAWPNVAFRFGR